MRMAIQTSEYAVARGICVAVGTCIPFTFVFSAVYGEILAVMIKLGTLPGIGAVAGLAFL